MSSIIVVGQATAPTTPTAGKVRIYAGTDGNLRSVDDAGAVTVYAAGITQEQVEDIVGTLLQDTSSVNVTYNDAGNAVTFDVLAGGVNHNALLNYVANQHVDHSAVTLTAGVGLSGGGDITAPRTFDLEDTAVTPGTYGSASVYPVVTVDQQGRLTAVTTQAVPGGALTAKNVTQLTNASNVTLVSIPNMTLTLAANTTYSICGFFIHSSTSNTTGIALSFNGGTVTPTATTGYVEGNVNTTAPNRLNFVAHTTVNKFSGVAVVNQDQITVLQAIVVVGATGGTFIPQFRSETNGQTLTLQVNSYIEAMPI